MHTIDGEALEGREAPPELTREQALDLDAVAALVGTAHGRRILWRLLESAGVFRLSYTGDIHETLFREGRRAVGLELLALIVNHMPHSYAAMLTENTINV